MQLTMALSSAQVAAAVLCATLGLWVWARSRRTNHLPHPPGPPGLPLIGNLLDVPSPQGFPWETYNEWSRRYSTFPGSSMQIRIPIILTLHRL